MTEVLGKTGAERLAEAAKLLPRRRFLDEMPDKGLFGFVAVFGFVLIIALKTYEYGQTFVACLAVSLMLIYGLISYRIPAVQMRLDRLGDNFYYLGFIFTLASMSAALFQIESGAPIEALLGSFGIALFTTIVGVAGRVLFVQMRWEMDEVEVEVRRDLLAASADLKGQLGVALRDFEVVHKSAQQIFQGLLTDLEELAKTHQRHLEDIAKASSSTAKETFEPARAEMSKFVKSVGSAKSATESLSEKFGSVEFPTDKMEKYIDTFGAKLLSVADQMQNVVSRMEEAAGKSGGRGAIRQPTPDTSMPDILKRMRDRNPPKASSMDKNWWRPGMWRS